MRLLFTPVGPHSGHECGPLVVDTDPECFTWRSLSIQPIPPDLCHLIAFRIPELIRLSVR